MRLLYPKNELFNPDARNPACSRYYCTAFAFCSTLEMSTLLSPSCHLFVHFRDSKLILLRKNPSQAIVNARPSTALIAAGGPSAAGPNGKPTPRQIQNQIQLQAQALIHAHTQAQIAAGIYKGGEAPAPSAAKGGAPAPLPPPAKPSAAPTAAAPPRAAPAPASGIVPPAAPPPGAAATGLLPTLTPSQLAQQNALRARHQSEEKAVQGRHAAELARLRASTAAAPGIKVEGGVGALAPADGGAAAAQAQIQARQRHSAEVSELSSKHSSELGDLHARFRQQNAAAEYAGVKVMATVPNSMAGTATAADAISGGTSAPTPGGPGTAGAPSIAMQLDGMVTGGSGAPVGPPAEPPHDPAAAATSPVFLNRLRATLQSFWSSQLAQMRALGQPPQRPQTEHDFKNHNDLPLARIKRIMKSDEDVRMISAEAPVLFAKACEMFILELTLRSWAYSENNKRRTLQKEDIREAIQRTDIFDFLVDVIH